jgi:hypothetical protein
MSSIIINNIPNIKNLSYLELGVFDNVNFKLIKCKNKLSVDVNGVAMFTGTTDEFFSQLDTETKFDIIFIDANHDYEYVLRDFNNSVKHCSKWVLIHDMIPPNKKHTASQYCSDSFKILYFLLKETNFEIYPMNENFGLTLVKMPTEIIEPGDEYKNASYEEFKDYISKSKLYSNQEITNMLRKENV